VDSISQAFTDEKEREGFRGCDPKSLKKVKQMMEASRHKRENIAAFK